MYDDDGGRASSNTRSHCEFRPFGPNEDGMCPLIVEANMGIGQQHYQLLKDLGNQDSNCPSPGGGRRLGGPSGADLDEHLVGWGSATIETELDAFKQRADEIDSIVSPLYENLDRQQKECYQDKVEEMRQCTMPANFPFDADEDLALEMSDDTSGAFSSSGLPMTLFSLASIAVTAGLLL